MRDMPKGFGPAPRASEFKLGHLSLVFGQSEGEREISYSGGFALESVRVAALEVATPSFVPPARHLRWFSPLLHPKSLGLEFTLNQELKLRLLS